MMIYGEIDTRLEGVVTFDDRSGEGLYLLVVHPNDTDDWVQYELPVKLSDPSCRGVMLVKGVSRSGLKSEEFVKLKRQYGDRFYACARSVGTASEPTKLSGELRERFKSFFQHVRDSADTIDWSMLEPTWPASLISTYLLARVLATGNKAAGMISDHEAVWSMVWEEARKEYESLTGLSLPHPMLNTTTASELAQKLSEYLRTVEVRGATPLKSPQHKEQFRVATGGNVV
jgi:hypothetical protein